MNWKDLRSALLSKVSPHGDEDVFGQWIKEADEENRQGKKEKDV